MDATKEIVVQFPVSYSSANLFDSCPARWKAEKLDKIKGARPIYMLTGIFLHEVTELYLKHLKKERAAHDFAAAEKLFELQWAARDSEIPEALYEELKDVWEIIKTDLVMPRVDEIVDAEMKIALRADWTRTDWDAPDAWLRCKIDRLEADSGWHLTIWDLKTGYKIDTPEESIQGKVYGAVIRRLFPQAEAITFELFYPRFRQTKAYTFGAKDFEEGERWITSASKRIEAARAGGGFRATPGGSCADCPVFYDCEARKRVTSIQPPRDLQQAEKMFERLMLIERERKDVQNAVKGWIDDNGPIEANGMVVLNKLSERIVFPIDSLIPILKRRGIDLEKVVKADNDKLERAVKRDDALGKDLEAIKVNKSTTSFKIERAGV